MTRAEIKRRNPRMTWVGYGQYKITCLKRGKEVKVHSTDSRLFDRINSADYESRNWYGAMRELINRCSN